MTPGNFTTWQLMLDVSPQQMAWRMLQTTLTLCWVWSRWVPLGPPRISAQALTLAGCISAVLLLVLFLCILNLRKRSLKRNAKLCQPYNDDHEIQTMRKVTLLAFRDSVLATRYYMLPCLVVLVSHCGCECLGSCASFIVFRLMQLWRQSLANFPSSKESTTHSKLEDKHFPFLDPILEQPNRIDQGHEIARMILNDISCDKCMT